uniref:Serpentine receptor class gamma n=1 Tax=Caenorhabditis tropicalis TaxID=1561998 RepID=A0A1I7U9U2_9PELO
MFLGTEPISYTFILVYAFKIGQIQNGNLASYGREEIRMNFFCPLFFCLIGTTSMLIFRLKASRVLSLFSHQKEAVKTVLQSILPLYTLLNRFFFFVS